MIFITTMMSFLLIACAQPDQILVSGSTTVQPAVAKSAEAYNFESGQIVIVSAGGSGTGFRELAVGKTQTRRVFSNQFQNDCNWPRRSCACNILRNI